MKKRIFSVLLIFTLVFCTAFSASAVVPIDETEVYQKMIALKAEYPEGMRWTNENYYRWNGGYYSGGYGCAGFAFILSDAAFGDRPARFVYDVSIDKVRVGDILRINGDTHSVIVLEVHSNYVIIAEGNYNSSIHWGRRLSKEQVAAADYIMTRYPEIPFYDVNESDYYYDAVKWALESGVTEGTDETHFSPHISCTRGQVVTFLWRANGSPEPKTTATPFKDVSSRDYFYKAVLWALENGITAGTSATEFSPDEVCSRAQVITFIWRTKGKPQYNGTNNFKDVSSNDYFYHPVLWAYNSGIANSTSYRYFSPNDMCPRAQIVTFLYNAQAQ